MPAPQVTIVKGTCKICQHIYGTSSDGDKIQNATTTATNAGLTKTIKISSTVINRSLRPINGIFFGIPYGEYFRRECDTLSRDTTIRNCGPGYIIRKAMGTMKDEFLDQPFLKN